MIPNIFMLHSKNIIIVLRIPEKKCSVFRYRKCIPPGLPSAPDDGCAACTAPPMPENYVCILPSLHSPISDPYATRSREHHPPHPRNACDDSRRENRRRQSRRSEPGAILTSVWTSDAHRASSRRFSSCLAEISR